MKHEHLHTLGIYIVLISIVLLIITSITCESDLPFKFTIILGIATGVLSTVGYILTTLFKEENSKWKKR